MFQVERKILEWVQKHIPLLLVMAATVIGTVLRFDQRHYVSTDYIGYLMDWYEKIKAAGALQGGLREQVGSYNLLFQFLIALMTYLPIDSLFAYKMLSILFDYLLAVICGWFVYDLIGRTSTWKGALAYSCVLCSPIVILNSATWAQCDVIYTFFIMISLYYFTKERYIPSFLWLGVGFAFKLQALFILPLYAFWYFSRKKFTVLHFLIPFGVLFLSGLPNVILGGRGLFDVFEVYFGQTEWFGQFAMNYPSFWLTLCTNPYTGYEEIWNVAMLSTIVILAILMVYWLYRKVEFTGKNLLYMGLLLIYTCILFMPGMHERYGYSYEILSILIAFLLPETIPLTVGLLGISMTTYGSYLYYNALSQYPFALPLLSVINIGIYLTYVRILNRKMSIENKQINR